MSIRLRANLDYLLEDKDLHFDMTDGKKLAIKTKCGQNLVVFNDLVFAKKEPTKTEIDFVKEVLREQIDEINKKIKRLKELEQNEPEKVSVYKEWSNEDSYKIAENGLEFSFNTKTKEIFSIRIDANNIKEIENKIKQIEPLIQKAEKYIKWKKEKDNLIQELNQNCNI